MSDENTPDAMAEARSALKALVDQLAVAGVAIDATMQDAIDRMTAAVAEQPAAES